jgi:protein TonB
MFEGSLVESRGLVASKTQKWTALGSLTLQCAIAALLIAIPMLRPETLPVSLNAPHITVPELRHTQVVERVARAAASAAAAMSVPTTAPVVEPTRRFVFPLAPSVDDGVAPPTGPATMPFGDGQGLAPLAVIGSPSAGPAVVPRVRDVGPLRVSKGVLNGMLLTPIMPVYPAIAKVAGVQGTVVIEAVISKAGRVERLNVVSGPAMLRNAALDAVSAARYAPYRLNGDPVDVQTTITVVFKMGT